MKYYWDDKGKFVFEFGEIGAMALTVFALIGVGEVGIAIYKTIERFI